MTDYGKLAAQARERASQAAERAVEALARADELKERMMRTGPDSPDRSKDSLRAAVKSERQANVSARLAFKQAADLHEHRAARLAAQGDYPGARNEQARADEARAGEDHHTLRPS